MNGPWPGGRGGWPTEISVELRGNSVGVSTEDPWEYSGLKEIPDPSEVEGPALACEAA